MSSPILTPEQLLIIADVFCAKFQVDVVDFAALYAAAATTNANFHGVRVHPNVTNISFSLCAAIQKLKPLSDRNDSFARFSSLVFEKYTTAWTEI